MALKPPRLNTQGPVEDFLRQVYRWSLDVDSEIETIGDVDLSDIEADIADLQADVAVHETRLDDLEADVADHETRIDALEAADEDYRVTTYGGCVINPNSTSGATYYHRPIGENASTTTLTRGQMVWGRTGTIKNFRIRNLVTSGDVDTKDWAVNINGSDTALVITGVAGNDTAQKRDTTNSASINAEDLLTIRGTNQVSAGAVVASDTCWTFDFVET